MSVRTSGALWQFFAALFITSLALNWLWEMIQMPAYSTTAGQSWRSMLLLCTIASLGDAAVTLGIYAVSALATRRWRWAAQAKWKHYVGIALLGVAAAVIIEKAASPLGLWAYSSRMPIVPVLRVGLWPLLQLTLLVPLAVAVAACWSRRAAGSDASG